MAATGIDKVDEMGTSPTDDLAVEQIKRYESLRSKRDGIFMSDWQHISQYFLPQESDIQTTKTEGVSGWTDRIFDTTGIDAAQTLASGQFNWWTPPNQPWAELQPPEELKKPEDDDSMMWLGMASEKAMREFGRSNFYQVKGMGDLGLSVFGTDMIIFDESDEPTEMFNFVHWKIGTYVIEENYRGVVDTGRHMLKMTWRQIEQKFSRGTDTIPVKLRRQAKADGKKEFQILHCIFPREDSKRIKWAKDGANKPVASVWIAYDFKECIRVDGYDESPILCRRFAKWGTDTPWGYGPAYLALPDARQVNYVQQYLDSLAELHAYPRILIPDNLEGDVDLRAGGPTVFDTSNPAGIPREWMSVGDYKLGIEMQQQRRQAIRNAFFNDAFKLLNSAPLLEKEMTAYEVSQRQAEQLQSVNSSFFRSIPEFINPVMRRGFGIMYRRGKLGKAPSSLQQNMGNNKVALVMPEIAVTSRFTDALRALKNRGAEETFKFLAELPGVEQHPEWLDPFDMDDTIVQYARNAGMSPENIRPLGTSQKMTVAQLRAQRAQMMQQQRMIQNAMELGKAGAQLGKAPQEMQDGVMKSLGGKGEGARQ